MTREAAEHAILDKLKEIREILHQYDAGSSYLTATIDGSRINAYNEEFKAAVRPIDFVDDGDEFRSHHYSFQKKEHDDAEGDLEE